METNNSLSHAFIGRKVIIRAHGAGVFFGTLKAVNDNPEGREVLLANSRRIWKWYGAATLSQLATEGTKEPNRCMFTVTTPEHNVLQVIEIIPCTEQAINSIEGVKEWKC